MSDFQEVYRLYFKDVYKYVLSLSKNQQLAEEITQETFFKALQNIKNFRGECKLYSWLCQIAKNTYYSYLKKAKTQLPFDEQMDFPDLKIDLEQEIDIAEQSKKIHFLLHQLTEPYKEVFSLRVFAELPFKQIGELFDKSAGWARVIFFRAKNKILEDLK
jgi:RNA polymerase sigma-70 factor (ECF subfamily)